MKCLQELKAGKCKVVARSENNTKRFDGTYDDKLNLVFFTIPDYYKIIGYEQEDNSECLERIIMSSFNLKMRDKRQLDLGFKQDRIYLRCFFKRLVASENYLKCKLIFDSNERVIDLKKFKVKSLKDRQIIINIIKKAYDTEKLIRIELCK